MLVPAQNQAKLNNFIHLFNYRNCLIKAFIIINLLLDVLVIATVDIQKNIIGRPCNVFPSFLSLHILKTKQEYLTQIINGTKINKVIK